MALSDVSQHYYEGVTNGTNLSLDTLPFLKDHRIEVTKFIDKNNIQRIHDIPGVMRLSIPSRAFESPTDPMLLMIAQHYGKVIVDSWGQEFDNAEEAAKYLYDLYVAPFKGEKGIPTEIRFDIMFYQGRIIGGIITQFGLTDQVIAEVIHSINYNFQTVPSAKQLKEEIAKRLTALSQKIKSLSGNSINKGEIAELWVTPKSTLEEEIFRNIRDFDTFFDNHILKDANSPSEQLINSFVEYFRKRNKRPKSHDYYRLVSLMVTLSGLLSIKDNTRLSSTSDLHLSQWTVKDDKTSMHNIFKLLENLDKGFVGSIFTALRKVIKGLDISHLLNLINNTKVVSTEDGKIVPDGTNPNLFVEPPKSHEVLVMETTLMGLLTVVSNYHLYRMFFKKEISIDALRYLFKQSNLNFSITQTHQLVESTLSN